jgi:hypothetical protein
MIRRYVKYQEDEERKAEQDRQDINLFLMVVLLKPPSLPGVVYCISVQLMEMY